MLTALVILATIAAEPAEAEPASRPDVSKKAHVPDEKAQAAAMKLVKEVYGDEYSKAKTEADKQALAKKLLRSADDTKDDPAGKFVLLRLARDIAVQAADGETAFQAVDAMAESFLADALEMKAAVLTKFAHVAKTPVQHKSLSQQALKLSREAFSHNNYSIAGQLGELALAEARQAGDKNLSTEAQSQIGEAANGAKAYEEVKAAKMTLEKTPDDPAANLVVGKYLCFFKGEWDQGLPMLALGKDDALKALATQELAGAASSVEQANLADGWWNLAEKQEGTAKKQMQGHRRLLVSPRVAGVEWIDER